MTFLCSWFEILQIELGNDSVTQITYIFVFLSTSHTLGVLVNLGFRNRFVFVLSDFEVKKIETVLENWRICLFSYRCEIGEDQTSFFVSRESVSFLIEWF